MFHSGLARPQVALLSALVLSAVLLVRGQGDFIASDPLWYADIANNLATDPAGVFAAKETHPFVMRVGLTGLLAFIYSLFGVSTLTSNLPAVLAALAIIWIVYAAAPTARAKVLGLLVTVSSLPLLRHGTLLNADLPSAALIALSIYCLYRRHDAPRMWTCAGVVAWFAAFLVKESALWAAPIWAYAFLGDVHARGRRQSVRTYMPALVVGLALACAYLFACFVVWDDCLARFRGIDALTYEHAWTLRGRPADAWVARLTWQPLLMLAKMFYVGLAALVVGHWFVRGRERIWLVAAWCFVLCYWFGSSGLSAYSPLPISERMALPIVPPLLVAIAVTLDALFAKLGRRWVPLLLTCAVIAPGCLAAVRTARRAQPETAAYEVLRHEVLRHANTRYMLVCDEPCGPIANFHFRFRIPANLRVVFVGDKAALTIDPSRRVWVLVHRSRARDAPARDLIRFVGNAGLPPVYCLKSVCLYDVGDGAELRAALYASGP